MSIILSNSQSSCHYYKLRILKKWKVRQYPNLRFLDIRGVHLVLVNLFGRPISLFFGRPNENCPISETRHIFCSVFFENWSLSNIQTGQKIVDKKICPVFETGKFFWADQKSDKLTGQLVDQEIDKNHMDIPVMC